MIQTGVGEVCARVPRASDRQDEITYTSKLLPPYLRRARSIEDLLPWLYLKGISTGDFSEALASLLGEQARCLSPSKISRLKGARVSEHEDWNRRSLPGKQYVYLWADGGLFP